VSEQGIKEICKGVREILQRPIVETTPEQQLMACKHVLKCPLCFLWSQRRWASAQVIGETNGCYFSSS